MNRVVRPSVQVVEYARRLVPVPRRAVKGALAGLREERGDICALEVRDLSDRMLAGVAARYGRDSDEYQMAGGTKRSERQRRMAGKPAVAQAAAWRSSG